MHLSGFPGRVIWRILRRTDVLARVSILGCAAMFAVGAATVLDSLSLSDQQVRDRDFGTYSATSIFDSPDPARWTPASLDALVERIGGRSEAALAAAGIRVGESNRTDVYLREGRWPTGAAAGVGLQAGRWPVVPGEVVVVAREGFEAQLGDLLSVYSGRASLSVVGVASDRYGEQPKLLAATGTLAMLSEALSDYRVDGSNPFEVLLLVHWDVAQTTSEDVLLATADLHMGDGEGFTSYRTDDITDRGWVSKLPAAFAGPAALLLAGSVGVSIATIRLRLSRFQRVVALLGGRSRFSTLIATSVSALANGTTKRSSGRNRARMRAVAAKRSPRYNSSEARLPGIRATTVSSTTTVLWRARPQIVFTSPRPRAALRACLA